MGGWGYCLYTALHFSKVRQLQPHLTLLLESLQNADPQPEPSEAEPGQQRPGRLGCGDALRGSEAPGLPPAEPTVSAKGDSDAGPNSGLTGMGA